MKQTVMKFRIYLSHVVLVVKVSYSMPKVTIGAYGRTTPSRKLVALVVKLGRKLERPRTTKRPRTAKNKRPSMRQVMQMNIWKGLMVRCVR